MSNIVLGNIGRKLFLQFSYSIQMRSLQPSYLYTPLLNEWLWKCDRSFCMKIDRYRFLNQFHSRYPTDGLSTSPPPPPPASSLPSFPFPIWLPPIQQVWDNVTGSCRASCWRPSRHSSDPGGYTARPRWKLFTVRRHRWLFRWGKWRRSGAVEGSLYGVRLEECSISIKKCSSNLASAPLPFWPKLNF